MNLRLEDLREVLDAVPDSTIGLTRDGTILTLNRRACALFGYEPGALDGESFTVFVPERLRQEYFAKYRQFVETPEPRPDGTGVRLSGLRKGGTEFPVEVKLSTAAVEGTPVVLASLRDMTERADPREQDLGAQRMQSPGETAGAISHDFNNLITVILCSCRLLRGQLAGANAESEELLTDLQAAATKAAALTKQLLTDSRGPEGAPDDSHFDAMTQRVRTTLASLAGEPNPRVHIVDDDPRVLMALAAIVESAGFRVVTHRDAGEFLAELIPNELACVVLDMLMPGVDGMSLLQELHETRRELPVIMVSGHGDIAAATEALRCGAVDFLEKPVRPSDLIDRIIRAFEIARAERLNRRRSAEIRDLIGGLTPRETEVMQLLCQGLSVKKIAFKFGLSHKTVQVHRARILDRTNVESVVDLANMIHELESRSIPARGRVSTGSPPSSESARASE